MGIQIPHEVQYLVEIVLWHGQVQLVLPYLPGTVHYNLPRNLSCFPGSNQDRREPFVLALYVRNDLPDHKWIEDLPNGKFDIHPSIPSNHLLGSDEESLFAYIMGRLHLAPPITHGFCLMLIPAITSLRMRNSKVGNSKEQLVSFAKSPTVLPRKLGRVELARQSVESLTWALTLIGTSRSIYQVSEALA